MAIVTSLVAGPTSIDDLRTIYKVFGVKQKTKNRIIQIHNKFRIAANTSPPGTLSIMDCITEVLKFLPMTGSYAIMIQELVTQYRRS